MARTSTNIQINLSRTKTHKTVEAAVFKWTTNIGKLIIIITELIALGALAYRFKVDGEIVDLHDKLKLQENTIKLKKDQEDKYRNIQKRLSYIKSLTSDAKSKISVLSEITDAVNSRILFDTNIAVNQNLFTISGNSIDVSTINTFINNMKQDPNVSGIDIDEFDSIPQGIKVKLRITLKTNSNITK